MQKNPSDMSKYNAGIYTVILITLLLTQACLPPPVNVKVKDRQTELGQEGSIKAGQQQSSLPEMDFLDSRFRKRTPIPLNKYRYEGSLWEGESSWGNLMRDHRARYRGDVLTVKDVQNVFQGAANYENDPQAQEIIVGIKDFSVRIVRTLDNGTLAIYGEKFDYRNNNNTRFQTILKGIIRPEDINNDNEIGSEKIARFELFTDKKVKFDAGLLKTRVTNAATAQQSPLVR